jgi:hypothetical protein
MHLQHLKYLEKSREVQKAEVLDIYVETRILDMLPSVVPLYWLYAKKKTDWGYSEGCVWNRGYDLNQELVEGLSRTWPSLLSRNGHTERRQVTLPRLWYTFNGHQGWRNDWYTVSISSTKSASPDPRSPILQYGVTFPVVSGSHVGHRCHWRLPICPRWNERTIASASVLLCLQNEHCLIIVGSRVESNPKYT